MADPTPAPETTAVAADHNPALHKSVPEPESRPAQSDPSSTSLPQFPNPSPSGPPPPSVLVAPPPAMQPSFRPAGTLGPLPTGAATPQFQHVLPYQAPGVPPPGVVPAPAVGNGPMPSVHPVMAPPYAMAGQPMRYGPPMSNGYPGMPQPLHQGAMPPGVPRYPSPYAPMLRPAFPLRPLVGVMPPLARPPVIGIRGPIVPPVVRPITPSVTSAEEPQTTVYVGKISSTVENDFMLSLLQLCGPVKNWKRPQDPTGTLKGFGFCEFESAEGVLRALRLLDKLRVDGQELMLNVNQTTRKYLERYVEKKIEGSKAKESATDGSDKEEARESSSDTDKAVKLTEKSLKPSSDEQQTKDNSETNKENPEAGSFSLVTDEDRDADRDVCEKLTGMLEERLKNKPLPPPPPPPQTLIDGTGNSNSEQPSGSKDRESEGGVKNDTEDKNEDDKTAESKPSSEPDGAGAGAGSPDRSRRHDRNRDRDRDPRRERERELERYEREREHERAKREKERENRSREDERRYKVREKEWESREREREHWRKRERERERERAHERKWEVVDQERDGDDGYGKKRKYKISEEERKRRQREKEEDLADRVREEEEIAEAKMRAEEDQKKQLEVLKTETVLPVNGFDKAISPNEINAQDQRKADQTFELKPSPRTYEVTGEGILQNGTSDSYNFAPDVQQNSNVPTKKLGFGLSGFGKRAAVPSVFNEDEDEDAHKEKKMRPLVPIDYSTEEREAIQSSKGEAPTANMAAAAEFVKRISTANPKEIDGEKEKSRRSHERSGQRDRDRHEEENNSIREESRRDHSERERSNKKQTPEKQKLLDAKQLIDTIPKTKDELFSYEINWAIYDQNVLHERMRPWVSKKITDFLGEEEVTLVDYIVSSTQEHVDAGEMLERLQTILDDEAEMFVLKMWRMLIFEIKKVETGLGPKPRA